MIGQGVIIMILLISLSCTGVVLGDSSTLLRLNATDILSDVDFDLGTNYGFMMRVNTSLIPSYSSGAVVIDNVKLCLHVDTGRFSGYDLDANVTLVNNGSWEETITSDDVNAMLLSNETSTQFDTAFEPAADTCAEVTVPFKQEHELGNASVTIRVEDPDYPLSGGFSPADGETLYFGSSPIAYIAFASAEYSITNLRPYLLVNYTMNENPVLSLSTPIDFSNNTEGITNFNFTVTDVDLDSCEVWSNWSGGWHANLTLNSSDLNNGTITTTPAITISDGNYFWGVFCNDTVNNGVWSANRSLTVDSVSPQPFIDSPINTTYSYNESIDFNWSSYDEVVGVGSVWYNLDGATLPTSNITVTANTTLNLSEGGHVLYLFANDSLGQENVTSITFRIDISSPVLLILSPTNSQYNYNESLLLNYSVSDDSEINVTWYNLDEGDNITITGSTTFNVSEGTHTLYLYANDSLGWEGYSSVQFSVDVAKPSLELEYPSDGLWVTDVSLQFNFTTNDTDLDTCELWTNTTGSWELNQTFTVSGGSLLNGSVTNSTFMTLADERQYQWAVTCNDSAGNSIWSLSNLTFGVDSLVPGLMVTHPENGTSFTSSQPNCNEPRDLNFSWADGRNVNTIYQLLHSNYGVEINNVSINGNTTFSPTRCTTGTETYTLLMLATDEANNQNQTEITFTNAYQAPVSPPSSPGGGNPPTLVVTTQAKTFCEELMVIPSEVNLDVGNRAAEIVIMNNFNESVNIILQLDDNLSELVSVDGGGFINPNGRISVFLTLKEVTNQSLNGTLQISTDTCEGITIEVNINEKEDKPLWISKLTSWFKREDFNIGGLTIIRAYWVALIFLLAGILVIITKSISGFMLKLLVWTVASSLISYGLGWLVTWVS